MSTSHPSLDSRGNRAVCAAMRQSRVKTWSIAESRADQLGAERSINRRWWAVDGDGLTAATSRFPVPSPQVSPGDTMGFARRCVVGLSLVAWLGAGCVAVEDDRLGTIGLELVGQTPSGTVYRLRDAVITVQGPTSTTIWNTEDAPDRTSLSANVVVGDYSASVQDGWRLERLDGSIATPVAAQLASDNPVLFAVTARERRSGPLQFRVNAELVDMSQGSDVVVTVQESPPLLAVASSFGDGSATAPSIEV